MSSDIYTVAVESVAGAVVTLEVRVVHPDIFVLPTPGMGWETTSYDMGAADR